jgi:hypothetical protein
MKKFHKGGQFFSLYLVFLTLFFIGVVLMLYYVMNQSVENRMISPEKVLDIVDQKEAFEIQEKLIFTSCIRETIPKIIDFSQGETFIDAMRDCFYSRILRVPEEYYLEESFGEKEFRDFLFSGLVVDGKLIDSSAIDSPGEWQSFFDQVYEFEENGEIFIVRRKLIEKFFKFKVSDGEKINFPVDFNYVFSRKLEINLSEVPLLEISSEEEDGFDCDMESWIEVDCNRDIRLGEKFNETLEMLGPSKFFYYLSLTDIPESIDSDHPDRSVLYWDFPDFRDCSVGGWIYDNYLVGRCLEPYPRCNKDHPDMEYEDTFYGGICYD